MNRSKSKLFYDFFTKKLVMAAAAIIVLAVTTGFVSYETSKTDVMIMVDGKEKSFSSHAENVRDALSDYGISVNRHDEVEPGLNEPLKNGMKIEYTPAHKINFTQDGEKQSVWSTASTVKEFLGERNISVNQHDKLKPGLATPLKTQQNINLQQAVSVDLVVGGKEKQVWTTSTTVADLLKQNKVKLGDLDRVEPAKETKLNNDMKVNIIRVEKVTDVVEEDTPFATVTRKDGKLAKGKEKVVEPGSKGRVSKKYEVVLENGKEVSRKLKSKKTLEDSSDKVIAEGTKPKPVTVSRGKSTPSGGKELYVTSTAYTASCAGCSGKTRTGLNLHANPNAKVIAVDPKVIPLGSKVYVEGYGYAIASDTGGAINGNRIDVFFSSQSEAVKWGRKTVRVKIIK
ncbi:ubiquitin-like domain-containing protein [Fictibacillus sp. B-59209]|uniref:ubiquitin-like domain-containing protein n=1 Tax=Fictibacillus sp. B-59209 TaxID=3024873 RepID=UPI002E201CF9|nr:ubiquitin-like domain-containing protein [Fictibacillus sp. B-59209]